MPDTAPEVPIDSLPGRTLGGYLVKQRLSEGGMGMVYLAEHQTIGRRAAVKFLRPEVASSGEWTARFLTEARALAALKHRNLVEVFEFGATADGFQYLMMEFIEGTSLEHYLAEQNAKGQLPLAPAVALKFAEQILNGLGEAHKKGVVHRDLKPANVMKVREHSGEVLLKIVDFGLARQDPVSLLSTSGAPRDGASSLLAGTPEYIAPEQARGLRGDGRADLYALGVMLYEMLAGQLPFRSPSVTELMKQHLNEAPPPLMEAAPGLPEGVADFVHQLLAKEPDQRPPNADVARQIVHRLMKAIERDATSIKPMPTKFAQTAKIERVSSGSTTADLIAAAVPARRRKLFVLLGFAALLLLWFIVPDGQPPQMPARVLEPALSPVVVEATPSPPPVVAVTEPVPAPAPVAVEPEVAPLVKRPRPPAPVVVIQAPSCVPDDDWKKGAKATLNELARRASKAKSADLVLWADERERTVSAAIGAATTKSDCSVVDGQLADFKEKLKAQ